MKNIFLNKTVIVFLFLILIVAVLLLSSKWPHQNTEKTTINVPFESCYAQNQSCTFKFDGLKVEVKFSEDIYYLKPFDVSVSAENKKDTDIESVQIDFKMKNMNMGVNRIMLKKISSENSNNNWKGKALLPVCVTGRADWISELEIMTKKNKYILTLPLNVKRISV